MRDLVEAVATDRALSRTADPSHRRAHHAPNRTRSHNARDRSPTQLNPVPQQERLSGEPQVSRRALAILSRKTRPVQISARGRHTTHDQDRPASAADEAAASLASARGLRAQLEAARPAPSYAGGPRAEGLPRPAAAEFTVVLAPAPGPGWAGVRPRTLTEAADRRPHSDPDTCAVPGPAPRRGAGLMPPIPPSGAAGVSPSVTAIVVAAVAGPATARRCRWRRRAGLSSGAGRQRRLAGRGILTAAGSRCELRASPS